MGELEFLTCQEFADKLKIPRDLVYSMIDSGRIKAIRLSEGIKAPWRIPYTELQRLHAQAYEEKDD